MSRQKSTHEIAKAAEVEAVGATAQGSESRVAGEGGSGGAGGLDVNVRSKTEGLEGWIVPGGAVGRGELGKVFERIIGNVCTGHITVELSLAKAICSHKLIKGVAMTTATKTLLRPLRIAFKVELSQSLVDECNGSEEAFKGFFVDIFNSGKYFRQLGTAVIRGVGVWKVSSFQNTIFADLPLIIRITFRPLIPYELLQCVGQPDDGTSRTDICIIHNLGQNFLNVIIFFIWLLSYRSGKLLGQAFNGLLTLLVLLIAVPPTHSQHPVNRLFKVYGRLGKGLLPSRHLKVPTNRLTYHNTTADWNAITSRSSTASPRNSDSQANPQTTTKLPLTMHYGRSDSLMIFK
ncbi:transposase [Babesia caballi]|uniref:Transposase n=1 Tax=Babesia caballi TaxID=5871 RepID=A0AAV4M0V7_BABCB|nr:transposase [Babesia caballi]